MSKTTPAIVAASLLAFAGASAANADEVGGGLDMNKLKNIDASELLKDEAVEEEEEFVNGGYQRVSACDATGKTQVTVGIALQISETDLRKKFTSQQEAQAFSQKHFFPVMEELTNVWHDSISRLDATGISEDENTAHIESGNAKMADILETFEEDTGITVKANGTLENIQKALKCMN
jgi:hypothetical protein